ncbi:MAG: hypothetical protein HZB77_00145 [Chloroflexi bacterium]|nr:hypothetical protein [Chloroflexota bacterium]
MTPALPASTDPLIAKIKNLFSRDLAMQNDYLRQENKILLFCGACCFDRHFVGLPPIRIFVLSAGVWTQHGAVL